MRTKNKKSKNHYIKSLSGSCDIEVKNKTWYSLYITVNEGYKFSNDLEEREYFVIKTNILWINLKEIKTIIKIIFNYFGL
jgi:hypothetical protein